MRKYSVLFLLSCFLFSCYTEAQLETPEYTSSVKHDFSVSVSELTDLEYPDNPDIGFRHPSYGEFSHDSLMVTQVDDSSFDLVLLPGNKQSDTIFFSGINLFSFIPEIPRHVHQDEYLSLIGIINQEWNRHQVRFDRTAGKFNFSNPNSLESSRVTRIDLARNCLNSGLWEIIAYARDKDGASKPYYHGWFNFPLKVYEAMFNKVNAGLNFSDYKEYLVTWANPPKQLVNLNLLRDVVGEDLNYKINVLNDGYYVETGARKKKKKNIIFPKSISSIQDFLTDSTSYSTFSPPGFYDTQNPRHTTLGSLYRFTDGVVRDIKSTYTEDNHLKEIELSFKNKSGDKKTSLIFGGLNLAIFPVLADSLHNNGYKYPMGIANHSFYETYGASLKNPAKNNPYYGFVLDEEGRWIDSHYFGLDGPLFFWDNENKNLLHLYLLSFERHSYVGHFTFLFNDEKK